MDPENPEQTLTAASSSDPPETTETPPSEFSIHQTDSAPEKSCASSIYQPSIPTQSPQWQELDPEFPVYPVTNVNSTPFLENSYSSIERYDTDQINRLGAT